MTFITFSLFLGGLAAMSIPVLLHLMMRGKPKRIEFPALMFIKKRLDIHRRNYRIKHLILLALRMLALVLFGLALARPSLKLADWLPDVQANRPAGDAFAAGRDGFVHTLASSLGGQDAPIAAAVVVDTSLRMGYVSENRNRLDLAGEFARWILKQLPPGSRIAILSCERETAVFQVDVLAARQRIDRLQIMPNARPVVEAASDALVLLAGSEIPQRELYILSDLSEPGWPEELGETLRHRIEGMKSAPPPGQSDLGELGLFVVDVGVDRPTDSALLQLAVSPQTAPAQSPIFLETELSHIGPAAIKTIDLLLSDPDSPDEETVRDTKTIDFPEGESRRRIVFTLSGFEPGTRQGRIRFTVPDSLPIDDEKFFTVHIQPSWKVLLVAQPPVRDRSLFLRRALETVPLDVETLPLSDLSGKTLKELQQYKAVFLLDPPSLDPVVWKKLSDYASAGGGVGVFLGPAVDALTSFNIPAATELLGVKLVRQVRDHEGELRLYPGNEATPILSPFKQDGDLRDFPWEALAVFRYWQIDELSQRAEVAIPFSDGRPAIVSQPLGRGRVVTAMTPVSELADSPQPWNQWTRGEGSWMFLLLAEGVTKYLVGAAEQQFNFQAGQPITIRPDLSETASAMPSTCLLGTPSGQSVRLNPDVPRREISIPETAEPGNYRIRSGGARESLDTGFSVNISGAEMILRRIETDRLDRLFGEKNYRLVRTPREIEHGIARRRVGQELYTTILFLLGAVFLGEYVFSNRFYGKQESGEQGDQATV